MLFLKEPFNLNYFGFNIGLGGSIRYSVIKTHFHSREARGCPTWNSKCPSIFTFIKQGATGTGSGPTQRVFTGTVTKFHENFGFVDEDVFFQTSVVKGQTPRVNVCTKDIKILTNILCRYCDQLFHYIYINNCSFLSYHSVHNCCREIARLMLTLSLDKICKMNFYIYVPYLLFN